MEAKWRPQVTGCHRHRRCTNASFSTHHPPLTLSLPLLQLEEMIRTVDSNFSAYFARFKCAGEVSLTDGRKLDDDGQPTGADDFSQYRCTSR